MKQENLFSALRAAFPADLDACAVEATAPDGCPLRYTWRDLEQTSARIANLLAALNLPPGSRVVVQVEKSVEAMLLYLATLRAGHVFVPLNTAYQSAEIADFIGDADPAVVVCSPGNFGWVSTIAFIRGVRHVFTLGADHKGSLLERAAHHGDAHPPAVRRAHDLAAILYTSGTTGRSKGAMLTHGNLLSNAQVLRDYWDWQAGDVLLHALPIFHVHGLFVAIHGALMNASKMIWLASFEPRAALAAMPRATVFMGVPTLYVRLLAEPGLDRQAVRNMRLFISGSAPLLLETFNAWQQRTGHTILERYGMSETLMLSSNPCGVDARHAGQSERRGATVGFPLPGVGLRVADAADKPLPVGATGGIQVRGPNVFPGYWRMPEKTAEEFTPDGWFRTGDLGQIDARGYLSLVGRSRDLIISGGLNVYPAEIEGHINGLPGVAESALVGVAHPDFGEVGVAVVVPRPGAQLDGEAICAALKAQLANFKIPKRCFVVAELPRNAMGKVQKSLLRAQYQDLFA
ncbi:malonyl-CoA synthase [Verminephrobacter aporrectodeae subsp. tuberculatae]|uniref:malonate--CoA ligase n=1 Tax=Verminephrobacter aporrectodeae TaxID=1110389 RepID=UPI002243912D|nr:malonyl-CoA synthase [Verminephrobacter aporrectodeae]MCW8206069.1 malonyl-CoA synthase [Verminephrobacter aporrectodeae subsp. tuberculatae]